MQKIAKKPCFGQFEVQTNLQRLLSFPCNPCKIAQGIRIFYQNSGQSQSIA